MHFTQDKCNSSESGEEWGRLSKQSKTYPKNTFSGKQVKLWESPYKKRFASLHEDMENIKNR